tara:strand:- start:945 stop:1337 length:393 start_codon:yes stop_codon:yes gene_type:complete
MISDEYLKEHLKNVRVKNIRPEYKNLKEWINDKENNEYIGRPGVVIIDGLRYPERSSSSPFANPFKITKDISRNQAIEQYREYIIKELENCEDLTNKLKRLKGKKLGCWCYPEKCHGNVLLELIEKYSET